jgi:hypothetical protein
VKYYRDGQTEIITETFKAVEEMLAGLEKSGDGSEELR